MNIQSSASSPFVLSQRDSNGGTGIRDSFSGNYETESRSNGQRVNDQKTNNLSGTPSATKSDDLKSPETLGIGANPLTPDQLRVVNELKQIDTKVRNHEMAHLAVGGAYITSGASFSYQKGPDGKNYAVGGEVGIDVSPVPGDPEATIRKMHQIRQAALAPGDPSPQDQKVAANAVSQSLKALSELTMLRGEEQSGQRQNQAFGSTRKEAAAAYTRVNTLPETQTPTFQLAV